MAEERIIGPTPAGGDYAVARFSCDGKPVEKDQATEVEIIEYSADGMEIRRTYGSISPK